MTGRTREVVDSPEPGAIWSSLHSFCPRPGRNGRWDRHRLASGDWWWQGPSLPEGRGGHCSRPHPFHGDNKLGLAGGDGHPLLWDTGQIRAHTHTRQPWPPLSLEASWRGKGPRCSGESPTQRSAAVISEGTGVVRISLVPRLCKPSGTRLRLADHSGWSASAGYSPTPRGPSWQVDGGGRNRWLKWGLGIWLG